MDFDGFSWASMDFNDFRPIPMHCDGFPCIFMDFRAFSSISIVIFQHPCPTAPMNARVQTSLPTAPSGGPLQKPSGGPFLQPLLTAPSKAPHQSPRGPAPSHSPSQEAPGDLATREFACRAYFIFPNYSCARVNWVPAP